MIFSTTHFDQFWAPSKAKADHIRNPQNDDEPVRKGKDGQELPASVGERLCRFLWSQKDEVRLDVGRLGMRC